MNDNDWLTVDQAAKLVDYHPEHIRELIRNGKIEARKFSIVWQVDRVSLLTYADNARRRGEKRGPKGGRNI